MKMSKLCKWDGYSNGETFAVVLEITSSSKHEGKVHKLALGPDASANIEQYVLSSVRGVRSLDLDPARVDWDEIAEAFDLDYDI